VKKPDTSLPTLPEPVFRLKLVYADGSELVFDGGGIFERDLIKTCQETIVRMGLVQLCRDAIVKRGVGLLRTEAHVAKDIEDGISEVVARGIEDGITEAIMSLKRESLRVVS
jgi:hypothetical protein